MAKNAHCLWLVLNIDALMIEVEQAFILVNRYYFFLILIVALNIFKEVHQKHSVCQC